MNKSPFSIPRRRFVKAVLLATGYSALRLPIPVRQFTQARADDIPFPLGTFALSLSDFPALQKDNGSVLVAVPDVPDVIVTRLPGPKFYAVTSVCTHQGCTVGLFDPTLNALVCPCHGSHYQPDGTVIEGPAPKPLYSYQTHFDGNDTLTIDLVKFSFPISGVVVPEGGRLRISFDSETGYNYEIRHKATLAQAEWESVRFSLKPGGATDQTLIFGTGDTLSLYVEAAVGSGFFVVVRWKLLGA